MLHIFLGKALLAGQRPTEDRHGGFMLVVGVFDALLVAIGGVRVEEEMLKFTEVGPLYSWVEFLEKSRKLPPLSLKFRVNGSVLFVICKWP